MAMQNLENEFRRTRDPRDLERADIVEIKRFTDEQREALIKEGYIIYGLTGQSIKTLRDAGRRFWSTWHKGLPDFEALTSMQSEVAINPRKLFLPRSNNKTLPQQEEMVSKFSEKLGKKVQGVKAIIGQAPDYVELSFVHFDANKYYYLFGAKYNYDWARTKTPTSGSSVAGVGGFNASGLGIDAWDRDDHIRCLRAVPLVMPV